MLKKVLEFYQASAFITCRARYCFTVSVRLFVRHVAVS